MEIGNYIEALWNHELMGKIIIAVISAFISFVATRFGDIAKIKSEQNIGFRTDIGKAVSKALIETRQTVNRLKSIEIYDFTKRLEAGEKIDLLNNPGIYPSIMTDNETYFSFIEAITDVRRECEPYLGCRLSAHIWIMERYLFELAQFIKQNQFGEEFPTIGAFVIPDLQKWQRETDRLIISSINRVKCRIEVKNGWRWSHAKQVAEKKYWKRSILYKVMNNPQSDEARIVRAFLSSIDNLRV